jgi:hypothetical protein
MKTYPIEPPLIMREGAIFRSSKDVPCETSVCDPVIGLLEPVIVSVDVK